MHQFVIRRRSLQWVVLLSAFQALPSAAQTIGGQVVDAGTRQLLPRIPVYVWRRGATGVALHAVTETDVRGLFQVGFTEAARYQIAFGDSARPMSLGPIDSLPIDSTVLGEFQVPLSTHPFHANEVEYQVEPLNSRRAEYPASLRNSGIEGEVRARWIVDATGAPIPASFEIMAMSAPAFGESVRRTVLATRWVPARWRGHIVSQLVEQPFSFLMR